MTVRTIHELSLDDCSRLLGAGNAGRVAVSTPTGPHVLPVNYAVDGESVLVRTGAHSLLGAYGRDAWVCFEAGEIDYELQQGWSVAVRGRARFVDDLDELAGIEARVAPRPWASGPRTLLVRIPWAEVTGRQVGGSARSWQHLPVRRTA